MVQQTALGLAALRRLFVLDLGQHLENLLGKKEVRYSFESCTIKPVSRPFTHAFVIVAAFNADAALADAVAERVGRKQLVDALFQAAATEPTRGHNDRIVLV